MRILTISIKIFQSIKAFQFTFPVRRSFILGIFYVLIFAIITVIACEQ